MKYSLPIRQLDFEFSQMDDMTSEMQQEAVEIITASVDKFLSTENYEVCAALFRFSVTHTLTLFDAESGSSS